MIMLTMMMGRGGRREGGEGEKKTRLYFLGIGTTLYNRRTVADTVPYEKTHTLPYSRRPVADTVPNGKTRMFLHLFIF